MNVLKILTIWIHLAVIWKRLDNTYNQHGSEEQKQNWFDVEH